MIQMRRWLVALFVVALIWLTAVMVKADLNDADFAAASNQPLGALGYLAAAIVVWWSLSFLLGVAVGWSTWLIAPERFGDSIVALLWVAFLLLLLIAAADITPVRFDFWLEAGLLMFFVYWLGCGLGWALRGFAMTHRHEALAGRVRTHVDARRRGGITGFGANAAGAAPLTAVASNDAQHPHAPEHTIGMVPPADLVPDMATATEAEPPVLVPSPVAVTPTAPVEPSDRAGAAGVGGSPGLEPASPAPFAPQSDAALADASGLKTFLAGGSRGAAEAGTASNDSGETAPSPMTGHAPTALGQARTAPEPSGLADVVPESAVASGSDVTATALSSDRDVQEAGHAAPAPASTIEAAAPAPVAPGSDIAAPAPGGQKHPGGQPQGLVAARDGKPDDLKLIRGIGKQNEERLHGLGIWHFDQIAAWTPDNALWVGSYLAFPGRIQREQWIAQAVSLAAGGPPPPKRVRASPSAIPR